MTTIIATKEIVAGDTFITYDPSFRGSPKVWVADGSAWGAAGPSSLCDTFRLWTLGECEKPKCKKKEMEVLQLRPGEGIFLWCGDAVPMLVDEEHYAIGTGAAYALGALSMGATPLQALEIAAKWSPNTRLPGHQIKASEIPPKRKRRSK